MHPRVAKYRLNPVRLQSSGGFSRLELSRIRGVSEENHEQLLSSRLDFELRIRMNSRIIIRNSSIPTSTYSRIPSESWLTVIFAGPKSHEVFSPDFVVCLTREGCRSSVLFLRR